MSDELGTTEVCRTSASSVVRFADESSDTAPGTVLPSTSYNSIFSQLDLH